jgi:hypothetical protein
MRVDVTHPFDINNRQTIIIYSQLYIAILLILRSLSLPPLLSPIRVIVFVIALVAAITVSIAVTSVFVLPPAVANADAVTITVTTTSVAVTVSFAATLS